MESERFCRLRIRYIEQIRQCRKDGKTVAYTDETWVWCGMGHRRDWVIPENYRDPLSEAVPPPAPTSREKRLVVLHCVTAEGLVKGAEEVLISGQRNEDGDYHRDMSFEVYKTWFTRLAATLKTNCSSKSVVLVLDNAPYQSKRLDRIPTSADTRDIMVAFLQQHEIPFDPS